MAAASPTDVLARFAVDLHTAPLSPQARTKAAVFVLDALGLAVDSYGDEPVQRVARLTPPLGEDTAGGATTWGGGWRVTVRDAVLLNGVGVHGRFQDDTDMVAWAHPSSVITPVAVTLTEHAGGTIDRACRALLGGYAALTWLGAAEHVSRTVVQRGFRAGPTLGAIAAAVTGSIALGLDRQATSNAIGIAADSAGGTLEPVRSGAEDWRIQHGHAAWLGCLAAQLADEGFRGPPDPLGGPRGWLHAFAAMDPPQEWSTPPDVETVHAVWQKAYPILGDNIAVAVPAAALADRIGDVADVQRVRVRMNAHYFAYPGTQNRGPFEHAEQAVASTVFNVALALDQGDITWDGILAGLESPRLGELMGKIVIEPDTELDYLDGWVEVETTTATHEMTAADCPRVLFFRDLPTAVSVYEEVMQRNGRGPGAIPDLLTAWARSPGDASVSDLMTDLKGGGDQ